MGNYCKYFQVIFKFKLAWLFIGIFFKKLASFYFNYQPESIQMVSSFIWIVKDLEFSRWRPLVGSIQNVSPDKMSRETTHVH